MTDTAKLVFERLDEMGIICDRRTLSKDIALLNEQGYEIMDTTVGHEKGYYVEDRSFSIPELKILMDAVQAASFITDKKTAELIEKIAELENVEVTEDEINAEFDKIADQYQMPVEQVKVYIRAEDMKKDIAVGKAVELVKESAKIK